MTISVRAAVDAVDWTASYPKLLRYATSQCRRNFIPVLDAADLIAEAFVLALCGTRLWPSSRVCLEGFLRGVIRSLASNESKGRARHGRAGTIGREDICRPERVCRETRTPEILLQQAEEDRALEAAVSSLIEDDPNLVLLMRSVTDGAIKRTHIAKDLGWSEARVTATRIKLQRRLARGDERFSKRGTVAS